jgi:hypothetical protein
MKSVNLKFVFVFLLSIAMVLSISACAADADSGSDETDAAATESPVDATEAPVDATEAPVADATEAPVGDVVAEFTFTNTGTEEICELYLSPAGQEDWGVDQLAGQTILGSEKFVLRNIPAGSYDVKAVGCAGSEVVGQLDIQN